MRWDGKYIYHYDGWNRLIQVDEGQRQADGQLISDKFIRAYVYDAFGRLVRSYGPFVEADNQEGVRSDQSINQSISQHPASYRAR
jgi:hypothetical protein